MTALAVETNDERTERIRGETLAERARLRAILTSREAEGRQQLARHLAFETDLTAIAAIDLLAHAPLDPQSRSNMPRLMMH